MKQACLSGRDISNLMIGKKVTAYGVDFVYDGTDTDLVEKGYDELKNNEKVHSSPSQSSK